MGEQHDRSHALRSDGGALSRTAPPARPSRVRQEIHTKLAAARTRLILERPFIGALVMHLPLSAAGARHCPTIATDARALYFNPDYIARLTLAETQFVLAHEALHCALAHFARRSHRMRKRWDVACDHAVNLILIQEGMRPPRGVLANTAFLGLTAEEIYPLIPPDTGETPLDEHLFEPFSGAFSGIDHPPHRGQLPGPGGAKPAAKAEEIDEGWDDAGDAPSSHEPRAPESSSPEVHADPVAAEALAQRWQSRLASAAQAAMRAGRLSDSLARSLGPHSQPRMPWRALLARFLMSVARDDYSFQRSSRREGEALLPRLASGAINLVIALDTSGSIGDEEMREFASEVDALKGQVRANLLLHACDDELSPEGPWRFAPWEPVTLPKALRGGGGTRFTPLFEWIEREQVCPDLLVYFTDAQGEFPGAAPPYPVIWLVKGRAEVPWGERIQLN
jgi:predicted metal-dependent peptidase